jgi:hypothetical protein
MCFSNLPIEFDDDGNPRLVESDPDSASSSDHDHDHADAGVAARATADDGLAPEARYAEIVADLPAHARDTLGAAGVETEAGTAPDADERHEKPRSIPE